MSAVLDTPISRHGAAYLDAHLNMVKAIKEAEDPHQLAAAILASFSAGVREAVLDAMLAQRNHDAAICVEMACDPNRLLTQTVYEALMTVHDRILSTRGEVIIQ